jgi:hypothetical protein
MLSASVAQVLRECGLILGELFNGVRHQSEGLGSDRLHVTGGRCGGQARQKRANQVRIVNGDGDFFKDVSGSDAGLRITESQMIKN